MGSVKQFLLSSFLLPGFPRLLRYFHRDCATVFMLHRFQDVERGITGCDASHLRSVLGYLIKNGYELVSLLDLFERLGGRGPRARGAVAFTIDDGYVEQATIAAPVFSEFDCPVTCFVSTGFLDGEIWFWWDQIEHVFGNAARQSAQVRVGDTVLDCRWESEDQRFEVQSEFTARCKRVAEPEKVAAIADLAHAFEVEIPAHPPPRFAPMSWDRVRKCEDTGMTFGPHTVTHPVLSRTTDEAAEYEIGESWARLRAEARNPVPIFCYPNGEWTDFSEREIRVLRRLEFLGALVTEPGYANGKAFQAGDDGPFRIQRFGLPDDFPHMIQYVSGAERLKQILRRSL